MFGRQRITGVQARDVGACLVAQQAAHRLFDVEGDFALARRRQVDTVGGSEPHLLAVDIGARDDELAVLVGKPVPDIDELAAGACDLALVKLIELHRAFGQLIRTEGRQADPDEGDMAVRHQLGKLLYALLIGEEPGVGAVFFVEAVADDLLAVVGADHHDDDRWLQLIQHGGQLLWPVIIILAHKAGGDGAAGLDDDAGRCRKGVCQSIAEPTCQKIADDEDRLGVGQLFRRWRRIRLNHDLTRLRRWRDPFTRLRRASRSRPIVGLVGNIGLGSAEQYVEQRLARPLLRLGGRQQASKGKTDSKKRREGRFRGSHDCAGRSVFHRALFRSMPHGRMRTAPPSSRSKAHG